MSRRSLPSRQAKLNRPEFNPEDFGGGSDSASSENSFENADSDDAASDDHEDLVEEDKEEAESLMDDLLVRENFSGSDAGGGVSDISIRSIKPAPKSRTSKAKSKANTNKKTSEFTRLTQKRVPKVLHACPASAIERDPDIRACGPLYDPPHVERLVRPGWPVYLGKGRGVVALADRSLTENERSKFILISRALHLKPYWGTNQDLEFIPQRQARQELDIIYDILPEEIGMTYIGTQSVPVFLGPANEQVMEQMLSGTHNRLDIHSAEKAGYILNFGGPARSCSWAPVRHRDEEYHGSQPPKEWLAITGARSLDEQNLYGIGEKPPLDAKNCIQIWSMIPDYFETTENFEEDRFHQPLYAFSKHADKASVQESNEKLRNADSSKPFWRTGGREPQKGQLKQEMILCLTGGVGWQVQFAPRAHKSSNENLGTLACATQDGTIKIYLVPFPEQISPVSDRPIYLNLYPITILSLENTSLRCFDWGSPDYIVTGCANGSIASWNLEELSQGSRNMLAPVSYSQVHQTCVNTVSIIRSPSYDADGLPRTEENPTAVLSISMDGEELITDLRCPYNSLGLQNIRETRYTSCFSPWLGSTFAQDGDNQIRMTSLHARGFLKVAQRLGESRGAIQTLAASNYHPFIAFGSADGNLTLFNPSRGGYRKLRSGLLMHSVYRLDYNRNQNLYRFVDNLIAKDISIREADGQPKPIKRRPRKGVVVPYEPGISRSFHWLQETAVNCAAWHQGGVETSQLLASCTGSGLCRIDVLQGKFWQSKMPKGYGTVQQAVDIIVGNTDAYNDEDDEDENDNDDDEGDDNENPDGGGDGVEAEDVDLEASEENDE